MAMTGIGNNLLKFMNATQRTFNCNKKTHKNRFYRFFGSLNSLKYVSWFWLYAAGNAVDSSAVVLVTTLQWQALWMMVFSVEKTQHQQHFYWFWQKCVNREKHSTQTDACATLCFCHQTTIVHNSLVFKANWIPGGVYVWDTVRVLGDEDSVCVCQALSLKLYLTHLAMKRDSSDAKVP